mgnify:CR=1 FL=1
MFYYETSGGSTYKTVIPWMKNPSELDGVQYFQMKGGWPKETLNYVKFVEHISDLENIASDTLRGETYCESVLFYDGYGDIVYVEDIEDFDDYFDVDRSHYFILFSKIVDDGKIVDSGFDKKTYGDGGWLSVSEENDTIVRIKSIVEE